jgi:uncharacterized RDD family membrane protein YckC
VEADGRFPQARALLTAAGGYFQYAAAIPPPEGRLAETTGLDTLAKDLGAQEYWMRRLVAIILDALLVGAAAYILSLGPFPRGPLELSAAGGLMFYLYSVVLEYLAGQTLGKMLMGLRVVGVGSKVDLSRLLVREVSKVFIGALILDVLAGILVEKNGRQRYLEVLSDTTQVVERR